MALPLDHPMTMRWLVMLMIEGTEGKKGLYVHVTA